MRTDYEERRQSRIERYEDKAAKAQSDGAALVKRGMDALGRIPFGQPILVGHHSEKRDRNYRARAGNAIDKGLELQSKAEHYAQKAAAAQDNSAINSDDPEAVTKLRERIDGLEAVQAKMREVNSIIRKYKKEREAGDNHNCYLALEACGLTSGRAADLLKPDFCGRIGFADYQLTNNSGNIRRLKLRLAELEKQTTQTTTTVQVGDVEIIDNVEANRLQMFFPDKPSDEIRKALKSSGFRWSPSEGAWQRQRSNSATWSAERIAKMIQA